MTLITLRPILLLFAILMALPASAEVLVYKWKLQGKEVYSDDSGSTYDDQNAKESGYLIVDFTAATKAYTGSRYIKQWRSSDNIKYVAASDFLNGNAIYQTQLISNHETVLLSGFNEWDRSAFYSGKVKTLPAAQAGGGNALDISRSFKGHSAWSYTLLDRIIHTGSGKVTLRLDVRRTRNANLSGQSVAQVENDLKTESISKGYRNSDPVAVDDTATTEMNEPITISVLSNDYDPQNATLSVDSITSNPTSGAVTINADKTLTYTPNNAWFGIDQFSYQISNSFGGTATAHVTITVTYTNTVIRASQTSDGTEATLSSIMSSTSTSTRYTVLSSNDSALGDKAGNPDVPTIYLFDRGRLGLTESILTINVNETGEPANLGSQEIAKNGRVVDDNGNYVIFSSEANNMLLSSGDAGSIDDTNGVSDIFVRYREDEEQPQDVDLFPRAEVGTNAENDNQFWISNQFNSATRGFFIEFKNWIPSNFNTWVGVTGGPGGGQPHTVFVGPNSIAPFGLDYQTSNLPIGIYYVDMEIDDGSVWRIKLVIHDIFIRRASISSAERESNGASYGGTITAQGGEVAFYSSATNLVASDTNNKKDVFVHTGATTTTTRVSVSTNGTESNGDSENPCISSTGRFIVFESRATNLDAAATNGKWQIYLHDRDVSGSGTFDSAGNTKTELISRVSGGGAQGDGDSHYPEISGPDTNGLYYVVYHSYSTNLDSAISDNNGVADVYRYILDPSASNTGATTRISIANDNSSQGDGDSMYASITSDGKYVAFQSESTNLTQNDTNGKLDIFLRDLVNNTTTVVSLNSNGDIGNGASTYPSISGDGNQLFTSFTSVSSNLLDTDDDGAFDDDMNGVADIFVEQREID